MDDVEMGEVQKEEVFGGPTAASTQKANHLGLGYMH